MGDRPAATVLSYGGSKSNTPRHRPGGGAIADGPSEHCVLATSRFPLVPLSPLSGGGIA